MEAKATKSKRNQTDKKKNVGAKKTDVEWDGDMVVQQHEVAECGFKKKAARKGSSRGRDRTKRGREVSAEG